MEFEDVDEKIELEARRVAAAFGLVEWELVNADAEGYCRYRGADVEWQIRTIDGEVFSLEVGAGQASYCDLFHYPDYWIIDPSDGKQDERMARGLYLLGFEEETVLAELNYPLSAHEKLELRLSLPREFWPKTWLEEAES